MAVMPGLEPVAPLLAQTCEYANQHPLVTIKPRTRVFERFAWKIAVFVITLPSID